MVFGFPDNGGGVDGKNQLGFANFKKNPFTPRSSAVFGPNSSSTTALPNPPANTTGGLFGTQTANYGTTLFPVDTGGSQNGRLHSSGLSRFSSTEGSQFGEYSRGGTPFSSPFDVGHKLPFGISTASPFDVVPFGVSTASSTGDQLFSTNPTTGAPFSSQISTSVFHKPSNSMPSSSSFSFQRPGVSSSSSNGSQSGISSSPSVSQFGGQHSSGSGWSPFSSNISISPAVSQFGGQHSSGWSPFSCGISSSPVVSQLGGQHSSGSGWSPFSSAISSSPTVSLAFGVPFSSSTSPFGPFTRSLVPENTSANNLSPFAPTLEVDNGKLVSISATPFYKEKSHEELRLRDYQLTGRTGSSIININSKSSNQHNTLANNVSVFAPFTNSDPGRSGFQGTKWFYETCPVEGGYATAGAEYSASFAVVNTSNSVSTSLASTSSSSSIGSIPGFNFSNPSSAFESLRLGMSMLSTGTRLLGDVLATTQTIIPVPTSGTVPAFNNATVSENAELANDDEDVMAMIPKLKCPEYYTEPSTDDLVENELKRPGFCRNVKDFVIGKRGYGSVKFLGETDVRKLDLESIVQFNTREVIFCMDKAKPPVGQGLNKAAEITLLNVDCIDKNTGKQYIDGPEVDKYEQLLVRKTAEQGAEFVSFDPAKGEWKFKVQHF